MGLAPFPLFRNNGLPSLQKVEEINLVCYPAHAYYQAKRSWKKPFRPFNFEGRPLDGSAQKKVMVTENPMQFASIDSIEVFQMSIFPSEEYVFPSAVDIRSSWNFRK